MTGIDSCKRVLVEVASPDASDLKLDAGDYISVALYHDTDAGHSQYTYQPTNTYAWTSFTGHLVCAL